MAIEKVLKICKVKVLRKRQMTEVVNDKLDVEIRAAYLTTEDLKLAASLLYQAYHDDPVFLEIFKET